MATNESVLRIGVIGCGHWGPNHIRVFSQLERCDVVACADLNASRLARIARRFPTMTTTADADALFADPSIEAIVIATPTHTHASLVRDAITAGKHVLVEKPLCTTRADAQALTRLAERAGLVLMVGHVFLYNPGIMKLRQVIDRGELGRIHYLDAVRTNLGPVRGDVNALVDLGTHDISIFNYLLGSTPTAVAAQGSAISQRAIEDVCFATLQYPDGPLGHIHVSWLNPRKVRNLTVVGQQSMATWDDVSPTDTVRLYDKGLEEQPFYDSFGEFQYLVRNRDVHIPKIDGTEPLVNQAEAFLDSVLDGAPCRSGGKEAEAVVAVLEAAACSIESGGGMCQVESDSVAKTITRKLQDVPVKTQDPWAVRERPALTSTVSDNDR